MLTIHNLSFSFGGRLLYDNVSLQIQDKDRVGLIGLNGTGKSTLLKIITGEYSPDGGTISKSNDCTLGFLNQDLLSFQSEKSILAVAMQAFEKEQLVQEQIDKILQKLETDYTDELIEKLAKLQEEFEAMDGYTIQARTEEILEGLGFSTADLSKPLQQFSGGWRMRVMLAKLLLQKPSILLLDEPTNHLDLPSIEWLEKYVSAYEGSVVVVSHDRYFLDATVNKIAEVANQKINIYSGNYSFYQEEKALRNEIQKGAFENQQAQIRQTERFISRFKAKSTKAKQVQSRVKALERLERVDDVIDDQAKVHFRFNFTTHPGRHIFRLEDCSKSFGDKIIFKNTNLSLERGDKVALLGANGKGKSTLLRIISGDEPISGQRSLGHNTKISFYAQHQLESLRIENALLDELKQTGTQKTEMELRTILGCFLFSGDDVFKKIKVLSGGEKSRIALAKVLISESNFLLLDEPTNHLDMQSVNILIQALEQYEGSFVVVSHDRYFVSAIANKILYIDDQELKLYPGTYEEYEVWQNERLLASPAPSKASDSVIQKPKESPKIIEPTDKKDKKLARQIQDLENQITQLEISKKEIEKRANSPDFDLKKYNNLIQELETLQQSWEEKMELMG